MDALSLNMRVPAEPTSLSSVKRSLPESTPIADSTRVASSTVAVAAEKPADPLKVSSVDETNDKHATSKDIESAVKGANLFFEQVSRELRFQHSESGNELVVQVVDQKTQEVIRQFPSEEMLQISKDLEKISGLLFKDSA
ncbi:MAG: flagellar protein FlaG [Gammaproteobacteria bacterium]|nr:flagellar protein FlaG [Gammaproteobacteria bacterium]